MDLPKQNKRKILFNYFSNVKKEDSKDIENKDNIDKKDNNISNHMTYNSVLDSSFLNHNQKNRPQVKHLSVDKYIKNKFTRNPQNRNYSTDITNKSYITQDNNNNNNKTKLNLNLNLNLNVTGTAGATSITGQKKIEDFLNNKFCKLDDSKLMKIFSKSPINNHLDHTTNLIHYSKNIKNIKHFNDGIFKINQNKTTTAAGKSIFIDFNLFIIGKKELNYGLNNSNNNIQVFNNKYGSINNSFLNNKKKLIQNKNQQLRANSTSTVMRDERNEKTIQDEVITDKTKEKINVTLYL